VFEGFLPTDKKGRRERFDAIKNEEKTIIFYEAPHKLIRTLDDMHESLGDRRIALCRELTKKYEEITRCTLSEAIELYKTKKPLGEYVIVVEGKSREEIETERQSQFENMGVEEHIRMYMESGMDKKDAIKRVAKDRNLPKSEVYKNSIDIK
jgi:16S rRNA (cytidine1402-2'-O)-methyltransferase